MLLLRPSKCIHDHSFHAEWNLVGNTYLGLWVEGTSRGALHASRPLSVEKSRAPLTIDAIIALGVVEGSGKRTLFQSFRPLALAFLQEQLEFAIKVDFLTVAIGEICLSVAHTCANNDIEVMSPETTLAFHRLEIEILR